MNAPLNAPWPVVLCDDEPLARARMITLLQRADQGVEVMAELGDAGAALGWLEAHPRGADVVFLDIQMPGLDGIQTTRRIRAFERSMGKEPVPIVAMTANGRDTYEERCVPAGIATAMRTQASYPPSPSRRTTAAKCASRAAATWYRAAASTSRRSPKRA